MRAFLGLTAPWARGAAGSPRPGLSAGGCIATSARAKSARRNSRSDWASAGAAAASAAAKASTRETAVLVETSRDDEPEGIVPREGLRAHLEPDVRVAAEGRVTLVPHPPQHVPRAHDAVHERAGDGGVRVPQEVITMGADSAIEIPIVLAGPSAPVRRDLPDVLIVLLPVVHREAVDQDLRGLMVRVLYAVYGIPFRVVPMTVRVALEFLLLGFAAVVIVEVRDPRHPLQANVHESALLPRVEIPRAGNGQVQEERLTRRLVRF